MGIKRVENWVKEYYIKREVRNMMKMLENKKTYLVAAAFAVIAFMQHMGYVDSKLAQEIIVFLNGAGFAALRASKK